MRATAQSCHEYFILEVIFTYLTATPIARIVWYDRCMLWDAMLPDATDSRLLEMWSGCYWVLDQRSKDTRCGEPYTLPQSHWARRKHCMRSSWRRSPSRRDDTRISYGGRYTRCIVRVWYHTILEVRLAITHGPRIALTISYFWKLEVGPRELNIQLRWDVVAEWEIEAGRILLNHTRVLGAHCSLCAESEIT